ncbi:MAG: chromosome segregation protein ScpA, partial [Thaumarchaeota archaeon]|nr:chromosome segregation protein ScpA [Nitrososphaerota archaeon]
MTEEDTGTGLAQPPVNILFTPLDISKRDVWSIDITRILELLISILNQSDKKDFRVAGIAALSSAMIHRMKVESIFALQKAAMEKRPLNQREDVDIEIINMPYRHESTYPVTLDELLSVLENLIGTIANPRSSRRQMEFEP